MKTYAELIAEAAAAKAELMARELTAEETARLRTPEDLVAEYPKGRSYAIGALVFDRQTGWWLSRTIARNVLDVHYELKACATNANVKDLHYYPEGF
jgi:hypothetical protein